MISYAWWIPLDAVFLAMVAADHIVLQSDGCDLLAALAEPVAMRDAQQQRWQAVFRPVHITSFVSVGFRASPIEQSSSWSMKGT